MVPAASERDESSADSPPSRSPHLTRRGLVGLAAVVPFSGCMTVFSSISNVTGNNVPASVAPDRRIEALGVVADDEIDVIADAELTLVYFFATWCGPCEPQLESLHDVRDAYDEETLAMRSVSPEDDRELVTDYWAENEADWPAAIDPGADLHEEYGVSVYPSIVLVDPEGNVRWHTSGTADAETIVEAIDAELENDSTGSGDAGSAAESETDDDSDGESGADADVGDADDTDGETPSE
ncbi:TlpA family protein disulfide reductase [Natrarchaeobaculum aegyptiacum]|uniref:Thioredoxin domain-containing protein n=1 Tax=Natrarchaeobaculum aegyptiacum TaxID=745377 RepID=A0A2Z2HVV4_9EURY|nr:TlpA disulfide reductase family protein [Natrarchaeobaculum aegyptiacum]ARS91340.1 hypothetical protein B1756_17510 [Natrarchaeobaculum aegyptiacum]